MYVFTRGLSECRRLLHYQSSLRTHMCKDSHLPARLTLEYKTHPRCPRGSHSPKAETLKEPSSLSGV